MSALAASDRVHLAKLLGMLGAASERATLLQLAVAMIKGDSSLAGITVIQPSGRTTYVDAAAVRRGGTG